MSAGSRKKRATRPWQDAAAFRDITDLVTPSLDDDLTLDGYVVRRIDGDRALKEYLCPECGNAVPTGESHVVVWPEEDSDLRRHWHTHCWRVEVRRESGR